MSNVILLGAGASFGSEPTIPTPPLGPGLFAALHELGGAAAEVPSHIEIVFRRDFEEGMALYYDYTNRNTLRFQRELAAYLAAFQPTGDSRYCRLLRAIGRHRTTYVSLNYDLLLEQAAATLSLNTVYGLGRAGGTLNLLKIHGSSNFWPAIPLGVLRGFTSAGNGEGDVEAPVKPLDRTATLERSKKDDSLAPAIAIYAKGKPVRVSQSYVQAQQSMWRYVVSRSRRVFVVGVKLNAADAHIWEPLAASPAHLTFVGYTAADLEAFRAWTEESGRRSVLCVPGDFRQSIPMIQRALKR
jgi:hypothetical protein